MKDFKEAPRILATFPKDNAEEVPTAIKEVTVTFDSDLDRNHISGNIYLETKAGLRPPVTISYENQKVTIKLGATELERGTIYRIVVRGDKDIEDGLPTGVRNLFGATMHDTKAIYFSTAGIKPPGEPTGQQPAHLKNIKERPVFRWEGEGAARFEIEVSKKADFSAIHWGNQYAESPVTPGPGTEFHDGTYYWRVRGVSESGLKGAWSMNNIFVIDSLELLPTSPQDTLPPEIGYDQGQSDEYVEYLDTFPFNDASNVATNLKTLNFRVVGDVKAEDVELSLYGESVFGEEADHGELAAEVTVKPGNGFTSIYVTLPI